MATLPPEFKKNLESAIIEHGRFACPSITCTEWITSKEVTKNDGSQFIEYHCTNSKCTFHSKKNILLQKKKLVLVSETNSSNRNFKRIMLGVASVLLILTVAFGLNSSSSNISKKEKTPVVKKERKIVLSNPVFEKED